MSSYQDSFGQGPEGYNDDPDGTVADARNLTDDQAEHPQWYGLTAAVDDPFEVPFTMPNEPVE